MNLRALAVASLLGLASVSSTCPTFAQSTAEDPLTTMARARFREGVEFYDKGRYDQARASFIQAYALKRHPAVLLNLAWSCLKGGHPLEAFRNFKQFVSEASDISDKARADADDGERQALGQLGHIDVVAPPGSSVLVDGIDNGLAPLAGPVLVEAGAHTVAIRTADGVSETRSVSVLGGDTATVRSQRTLVAAPSTPLPVQASATGAPAPSSAAGGPFPVRPTPSPASPETEPATSRRPSPVDHMNPAATSQLAPESVTVLTPPTNLVPVFLLAGFAIASYATAAGLYVVEQSALDKASQVQSDILTHYPLAPSCISPSQPNLAIKCNALATDNDNANSDALWGNIALGVGIAATAGTVVYWLVADKHSSGNRASLPAILPFFGTSLVGAAMAGAF